VWFERTRRALRILGVRRRACERQVNEVRSRKGTPNWLVERGLVENRARRAALAVALPLPRGRLWTAVGWVRDLRSTMHDHAFFAACSAYARDPRFFDRPSWPHDLLHVMAPVRNGRDATAWAAWVGAMMLLAAGRSGTRRLSRRWGHSALSGAALSLGGAWLWGRIESQLASKPVMERLDEHLTRGASVRATRRRVLEFSVV
jgi:hypothetical protein